MSPFEIDLETGTVLVDGSWLGTEELAGRITQAIGAKNFAGVGRLGEALEQLSREMSDSKSITVRLSGEEYARLAEAGQKVGQAPELFARELLMQVLEGTGSVDSPASPAPASSQPTPHPVIEDVSPEEAAAAIEIRPKRTGNTIPPPVASTPPPILPPDAG